MPRQGAFRRRGSEDEIRELRVRKETDENPDLSWLKDEGRYRGVSREEAERYREEDRERVKAFERGDWSMVGVWVEAEVTVNGVIQTIQSGGLWGIESDSDPEYFADEEFGQYKELKGILEKMGFARVPPFQDVQYRTRVKPGRRQDWSPRRPR